jgi:hypothetical protein
MEITHMKTKRGNKAIIVDGYMYRRINVLKNGDIVYICNIKKNCTKSITTDSESVAIIKAKNQYVCGYDFVDDIMCVFSALRKSGLFLPAFPVQSQCSISNIFGLQVTFLQSL